MGPGNLEPLDLSTEAPVELPPLPSYQMVQVPPPPAHVPSSSIKNMMGLPLAAVIIFVSIAHLLWSDGQVRKDVGR